jgi:dihydroorotate dehydrogenase (fumarate)
MAAASMGLDTLSAIVQCVDDCLCVDGLVLFNRFVQPDIGLDTLQVSTRLALSTGAEVRLTLRKIAILRPQLSISPAASTGVETIDDVLKLVDVADGDVGRRVRDTVGLTRRAYRSRTIV